jgi:CO/xanthine dehydrogenase FAD-binding subunit
VSLKRLKDLDGLEPAEDTIRLGANVTHRTAELSSLVRNELGALYDAVVQLASVQIRNVATVAGNICNAAPCADTAAPLMALGTKVNTIGPEGEKYLNLEDLFLEPGRIKLNPGELLKEFRIPRPPELSSSVYERATRRKSMDITIVGVAVYLCLDSDRKHIKDVRIALNTVAPVPIRAFEAEKRMLGATAAIKLFVEASNIAAKHSSPRTSFRSTEAYRREMVNIFVRRAMEKALRRIS